MVGLIFMCSTVRVLSRSGYLHMVGAELADDVRGILGKLADEGFIGEEIPIRRSH